MDRTALYSRVLPSTGSTMAYFIVFVLFFVLDEQASLAAFAKEVQNFSLQDSSKRTMRSLLRAYLLFCEHFSIEPYPVSKRCYILYLAFLGKSLRSFASLSNYAGLLKHINLCLGEDVSFMSDFECSNLMKGLRRFLGDVRFRKAPITISILSHFCDSLDPVSPLHVCLRALVLVAFFFFSAQI